MTGAHRWVAWSALELVGLFALFILLQNLRPFSVGVRVALPVLVLAVAPYLYVMRRLTSGPDARGLGFALIVALAATALIVAAGALVFRLSPLAAIAALPAYLVFGVFVATQIALIRQVIIEMWRGPGVGASLVASVLPCIVYGLSVIFVGGGAWRFTTDAIQKTSYSETVARGFMAQLYTCLHYTGAPPGARRFPADQAALERLECWDPIRAPGGRMEGTAYEFRYLPGPRDSDGSVRSFVMETRKLSSRRGPTDSWSVDHLGNVRRSETDWASVDGRRQGFTENAVTAFVALCEAYRELRGAYPDSLIKYEYRSVAPPGAMPLPYNSYIAATGLSRRDDGAIVVLEGDRQRLLVYYPVSADSSVRAFRVSYRARRRTLDDLRSYTVDEQHRVHVTAEGRDATIDDPVHDTPELAQSIEKHRQWARDFMRQATTAAAPDTAKP